ERILYGTNVRLDRLEKRWLRMPNAELIFINTGMPGPVGLRRSDAQKAAEHGQAVMQVSDGVINDRPHPEVQQSCPGVPAFIPMAIHDKNAFFWITVRIPV